MTWVVAGAIACAVLVVLAGLLIGRAMRAADRQSERVGQAGQCGNGPSTARQGCVCDRGDCAWREAGAPNGETGRDAH
ncbi:hypothetical protein [Modestobacter italicus]|uniref:hypothetical protein n=1 Tax=Modestobacter italicus (strain DSM 44449 / CECT 9708 / BC 501) TaxID=2732864 RepID=UPI001C95BF7C|nr:hypothetical protein [Modestobacter italicus]